MLRAFVIRRRSPSVGKLFQKPKIVLVEQSNVFDLILEDSDAFDADAPRKSGVAFGIVADGLEYGRMHHAASADLDPPGFLAHLAPASVALPATQIDFRAGLRIREETWTESNSRRRGKRLLRKCQQRAFQ